MITEVLFVLKGKTQLDEKRMIIQIFSQDFLLQMYIFDFIFFDDLRFITFFDYIF